MKCFRHQHQTRWFVTIYEIHNSAVNCYIYDSVVLLTGRLTFRLRCQPLLQFSLCCHQPVYWLQRLIFSINRRKNATTFIISNDYYCYVNYVIDTPFKLVIKHIWPHFIEKQITEHLKKKMWSGELNLTTFCRNHSSQSFRRNSSLIIHNSFITVCL